MGTVRGGAEDKFELVAKEKKMPKTINTSEIVEKLFDALSNGKITTKEWNTATSGWKIILKVIKNG